MNPNPLIDMYSVVEIRFMDCHTGMKLIYVDSAVDLDQFGNPVGVEFISLRYHADNNIVDALMLYDCTAFKFAHDDECDSSYLRFSSAKSANQVPSSTVFELNSNGDIACIRTKYRID